MTELQSISQSYSVSFDHSQFYIEVDPVRILNYVLAAIAIHIYTLLTVHELQKKKKNNDTPWASPGSRDQDKHVA